MKLGVALGRCNPALWVQVTVAAEELGYESVWIPEHLVFPVTMSGGPGNHAPPKPTTPVFDAFAYLSHLAGHTTRIRLATHVYNLALRHPFIAARAIATLDVVSNGRTIAGVGAGWLREEWEAAGLDFATRGRRLDEALDVCVRLWTEEAIEHHGEFFDFAPVAFEPKPIQKPNPPVLIGGSSPAALKRAARYQGWVGMTNDPALSRAVESGLEVTIGAREDDLDRLEKLGVHRAIVAPWSRSAEAVDGLRRLALSRPSE